MHNDSVYFNRVKDLDDLVRYSFKIGRTPILSYMDNELRLVSRQNYIDLPEKVYCRNGFFVGFKFQEDIYVLPCSHRIDDLLVENGFVFQDFDIPYSNTKDRPLETSQEWLEVEKLFMNGVL